MAERYFPGRVDYVHSHFSSPRGTPPVLDTTLDLGFGVSIRRNFVVDAAPYPNEEDFGAAKRCLLTLVVGKACVFGVDSDVGSGVAIVGVAVKHVPDNARIAVFGRSWLNLASFLWILHLEKYPIQRAWEVVNGTHKVSVA